MSGRAAVESRRRTECKRRAATGPSSHPTAEADGVRVDARGRCCTCRSSVCAATTQIAPFLRIGKGRGRNGPLSCTFNGLRDCERMNRSAAGINESSDLRRSPTDSGAVISPRHVNGDTVDGGAFAAFGSCLEKTEIESPRDARKHAVTNSRRGLLGTRNRDRRENGRAVAATVVAMTAKCCREGVRLRKVQRTRSTRRRRRTMQATLGRGPATELHGETTEANECGGP